MSGLSPEKLAGFKACRDLVVSDLRRGEPFDKDNTILDLCAMCNGYANEIIRLQAIGKAAEAETEAEDAVIALDEKVHVRGAPFTEFCNLMDAQTAASEARRKAVHGERGE